ncbi:hypothetical protein GOBAR_DD20529 [Gossypium barbadense]|nr:hypothetical protein GOBAR_DD20529 [Gossypium barbadense]
MSEKVFPSAKPAATAFPPAVNGGAPVNTNGTTANGGTTKSHLYNPTSRPPYRPQPYHRRHRPRRNYCCCCCFWTILIILILALLVAIAGSVFYVLYRPNRPSYTLASLRIHRLNLTTTSDSSSSHLSSLFNLTISSKNPCSYINNQINADAVLKIVKMPESERLKIATAARRRASRFSEQRFYDDLKAAI